MIRYAITDPSFFTTTQEKQNYLSHIKAEYVLFRDKINSNYKEQAMIFLTLSQGMGFKRILHRDYNLAFNLKADGVHLASNQLKDIQKSKELGLWTAISCHSIKEIKEARNLGADVATLSPIFNTPNKGEPKGIEELKKAVECCDIKIIALGGIITKEHIEQINSTNAFGFASIRYFYNRSL